MKQITRRQCLRTLGLGAVAAMSPAIIRAQLLQPRVVVVGGGFAGATTAKYLRHWSSGVDVTLVEANSTYYSPILSNLVLNGQRSLSQLAFSYSTLQQSYGINVVQQTVAGVDPLTQRLQLGDGSQLSYDRLVVAPGIRFRSVPGLDSSRIL
ncbi:MAG: FAD/NAD(P)-binding oxidoreductase, partial [Deltaproteobacteria bacterium]